MRRRLAAVTLLANVGATQAACGTVPDREVDAAYGDTCGPVAVVRGTLALGAAGAAGGAFVGLAAPGASPLSVVVLAAFFGGAGAVLGAIGGFDRECPEAAPAA
jgi:hypothetical protein